MRNGERELLIEEMRRFRYEVLKEILDNKQLRDEIEEIIICEAKIAAEIAKRETIQEMGLGIIDVLAKVDDIVKRLWDWWKSRKKQQD